jgi:hypothetical protein
MFDGVKFTGTVNLGNLAAALINILAALAVYIRVRAAEKHIKKVASSAKKLPGGRRKEDPPALPPAAGNDSENQVSQKQNNNQNGNNYKPG